jgi:RNA polymerase sigma-70 factor (ECF subfamily)
MDRTVEFRELYDTHRAAVHAYFVGRTGDRWLAADLMQETFLRAWRRFGELSGRSDDGRRAWIFTVARNRSIDEHRQARTRAAADAALRASRPAEVGGAAADVIASERVAVVAETIKRLPEQQRITLTMAAAGGLTSAEIATALGVPSGTIRYRLSLARRTLAEALSTYDDVEQP